jgi:hypothetical protein
VKGRVGGKTKRNCARENGRRKKIVQEGKLRKKPLRFGKKS